MTDYMAIAEQAEKELNSYQAKTGNARQEGLDDSGVNSLAADKFDGATVTYGDELSTNRGYNKRIPRSEGGILDDRGRQTRGEHYEGKGGPLDKLQGQDGQNDNDVVPAPVNKVGGGLGSANDIATQGREATQANVGNEPSGPGRSQFKGNDYYVPESVPDSISAEGWVAPGSVVESSREAERP